MGRDSFITRLCEEKVPDIALNGRRTKSAMTGERQNDVLSLQILSQMKKEPV
jgi:hypothetical protein